MLDSLSSSCHVINKCLKCDSDLDKYFDEEELDTSHWPCDKCLDVLKSIKMFWKIIIEKVFGISIPKSEDLKFIQNDRIDSVKSIAKLWEDEIVQQTFFVTPLLSKGLNRTINNLWKPTPVKKETRSRIPKPCRSLQKDPKTVKFNKAKSPTHSFISHRTRTIDTGRSSSSFTRNYSRSPRNKLLDCPSARVRMVDVACTCQLDRTKDELILYKCNVEYLQQKCTRQENEIENFRRENISLKRELQNFYKTNPYFNSHPIENVSSNCDITALVPKPFESCIEDGATTDNIFNNTDSEMIITMKNCKNESFKHVSLLQVLHKTNEPLASDVPILTTGNKKENPIELLTKVQNTFGAIVKREIRIVCRQKHNNKHVIDASFCNLSNSKSAPSCSTLYTEATSSISNFMTGCD